MAMMNCRAACDRCRHLFNRALRQDQTQFAPELPAVCGSGSLSTSTKRRRHPKLRVAVTLCPHGRGLLTARTDSAASKAVHYQQL